MDRASRAAVQILANEGCLAARGVTPAMLVEAFADVGLAAEVRWLEPDEASLARTREALRADPPTLVVAAGGDGTVHAVVNLIAPLQLPLGVIPLGTANDFARGLGLPTDLHMAAAVIADEAPLAIDLGLARPIGEPPEAGRYFVNAAHLGLGVETAKLIDPQLKRWLGPLAYGMAAVRAWREAEPLALEICVDAGCSVIEASQLLVGIGRFFGGGNRVGKPAHDAGLFEVYALRPDLGPAQALEIAGLLRLGRLGDQVDTLHFRTARLEVRLSRPAEMNLDGELLALGPALQFDAIPGGLSVYASGTAGEAAFDPWPARAELAWNGPEGG